MKDFIKIGNDIIGTRLIIRIGYDVNDSLVITFINGQKLVTKMPDGKHMDDILNELNDVIPQEEVSEDTTTAYDIKIDELNLKVRSYNVLKRYGINTVRDIVECYNDNRLAHIRNMGRKSYEDILTQLSIVLKTKFVDKFGSSCDVSRNDPNFYRYNPKY